MRGTTVLEVQDSNLVSVSLVLSAAQRGERASNDSGPVQLTLVQQCAFALHDIPRTEPAAVPYSGPALHAGRGRANSRV
jgi:hypothetical protein